MSQSRESEFVPSAVAHGNVGHTGRVSGWSVWPDQEAGVWRWSAYGPKGTRLGSGTSELNCRSQAQVWEDRLR